MTDTGIDTTSVDELAARMKGTLVRPGDADYDEARAVYNAMIDKRPALIARVADVDDVVAAVNYGREQGLDIAIRGGGHNGAGLGSVDDGLVIDLAALNTIEVDADNRTATIGGGALLGDVDAATNAHGLATPAGIIASTGAGGLMLGGGIGHLSRGLGLSIDNILGAQVVLADGSVVNANEDENPDLYWAIRGGGGNFGVVTSITARLHPVDTVVAGPMFWSLESAPELMRWYREFILNAPEELGGFFAFLSVPPAPPFPEELHLQKVAAVIWCWAGPAGAGRRGARRGARPAGPAPGRRTADAAAGDPERLRPDLPARRPVVLARGLRRGDPRRGDRAARRVRRRSCRAGSRPCTSTRSTAPCTASARPRRRGATATRTGAR